MISMSKYQHNIRKIEVTYVLVNSVCVVSSSGVIFIIYPGQTFLVTLMISNNKLVSLQSVAKVAAHYQKL